MPTDFEKKFAEARAKGKETFGFNGKIYSTKTVEEKVLSDVLKENPGLSNVIDEKNAKIIIANKDRLAKLEEIGGTGRYMETWHPDDPGAENFPNPFLGGVTFEVYNQKLAKDPKVLKEAIRLDALHMMPNDANWQNMRNEFINNFTQEELNYLQTQKYPNEAMPNEPFIDYLNRTAADAYLRGGLSRLPDKYIKSDFLDEYAQNFRGIMTDENGNPIKYDMYSPRQREIIQQMNDYLSSNPVKQ